MMKYRKKHSEIDAWQYMGEGLDGAPQWVVDADDISVHREKAVLPYHEGQQYLKIRNPEGDLRAYQGDWIVRSMRVAFYPCKPDDFGYSENRVEIGLAQCAQ